MIPTKDGTITTSGNMLGEKVAMEIDVSATQHLMSLLTNLYSDKELAIIREYATNAWDSHVEAGQTRPIEISTPNTFDQNFRVKDFGVGMGPDDIENIYSRYGASTKRSTNAQTGMLGLGCKSALTYAQQFYINAVKNGMATKVLVYRDENGSGVMEIIDTLSTDEPNGVEIVIPAIETKEFINKINDFFMYWPEGSVLVNGHQPSLPESVRWISDNVAIVPTKGRTNSRDVLVMGNVPYVLDPSHTISPRFNYYRGYDIVAWVPIGTVDFVPSREALHYTDRTSDYILSVREKFDEALQNTMQAEIDSSADSAEAMGTYFRWKNLMGQLNRISLHYKEEPIKELWEVSNVRVDLIAKGRQSSIEYSVGYSSLTMDNIVVGYNGTRPSRKQKDQMREWAKNNLDETKQKRWFILLSTRPGGAATKHIETIKWSDITAVDAPKVERVSMLPDEFGVLQSGGWFITSSEDLSGKKVVYFTPSQVKDNLHSSLARAFDLENIKVVKVYAKDLPRFLKAYPKSIHIKDYIKNEYAEAAGRLTENEKYRNGINTYTLQVCKDIIGSGITVHDPEVHNLVEIARESPSFIDPGQWRSLIYNIEGINTDIIDNNEISKDPGTFPFDRYPLITKYHTQNSEDMVVYINAKYKYLKEKENE